MSTDSTLEYLLPSSSCCSAFLQSAVFGRESRSATLNGTTSLLPSASWRSSKSATKSISNILSGGNNSRLKKRMRATNLRKPDRANRAKRRNLLVGYTARVICVATRRQRPLAHQERLAYRHSIGRQRAHMITVCVSALMQRSTQVSNKPITFVLRMASPQEIRAHLQNSQ